MNRRASRSQDWNQLWRTPNGLAFLGAFIALLLLVLLWRQAASWYEERLLTEQRAEIVSELSIRANALSSAVNRRLARLQGLHAFAQTEGNNPYFATLYEEFAAGIYAGSRGVRNLAIAPDSVMRFVYPREGNEAVLGYQPLQDPRPEIRSDTQKAITSGEVVVSGPVELVQGGLGLIGRQAVFIDGEYWGLANIVLDLQPLLEESGIVGQSDKLQFIVRDSQGRVFFGNEALFQQAPIIVQVLLPEGYWELGGVPQEGLTAAVRQPILVFRWAGLVIAILIASLVYLTLNRQSRLSKAVELRTQELMAANELLEQRVNERTLELSTLLEISRSVAFTLELEPLLEQVLKKLKGVLDYTGSAFLILENDRLTVCAYHGLVPLNPGVPRHYERDPLIGRQITDNRTLIIIPDVQADDLIAQTFRQVTGIVPGFADYVRSWMGVPLVAREQVIGILALHHQEPDFYHQRHADLAMAFANQVAVAIENARLYEKAQDLAILQERQRLARELHDSVSQTLYGIALGAQTSTKLLDQMTVHDGNHAALKESLNYVLAQSEAGLTEMRSLIFELRPESLEMEGLVRALEKQAAAIQARHHLPVNASFCDEPKTSLQMKEALYRVAQEALNNVVKHSRATESWIKLDCSNGQLKLEVADNGQGFDPKGNYAGHLGLLSMQERIDEIQGTLTITSAPGQGTRVVAVVPIL